MEQLPILQSLIVVSADLCGYGRLMEQDESNTHLSVTKCLRNVLRPTVEQHSGKVVKSTGDGALIAFHDPTNAIKGMIAFQQKITDLNTSRSEDQKLEFRIGVHSSAAIIDDGDLYGHGVNIAVRLQEVAEPGSILISQSVLEKLEDRTASKFSRFGKTLLKNTKDPILAHRWDNGISSVGERRRFQRLLAALAGLLLILVLPLNTSSKDPSDNAPERLKVEQLSEIDRLAFKKYTRNLDDEDIVNKKSAAIDIYQQAWVHYSRNTPHDLDISHKYLKQIFYQDKNNDEINSLLAAVYWRVWYNRWQDSLGLTVSETLRRAHYHLSKVDTPVAITHMVSSEMMTADGNIAGAIAEANYAITKHPRAAVGQFAWALAQLYSGKPELAEEFMRRAIRLDPHSSRYLVGLGLAQLSMEQFYKSIETLNRALDMNQENDWTYFLLAIANSYLGKEEEAKLAVDRFNELGSRRKGWVINHLPYIHLWTFQREEDRRRLGRIVELAGFTFQAGHDGD